MIPVATAEQIRQAEDRFWQDHPGVDLMGRAAKACSEAAKRFSPARVLVVVGSGNNGGDGLYCAAHLARSGVQVLLWQVASRVHEQGFHEAIAAGCQVVNQAKAYESVAEVDLVIDAVLGIGGRPGLREPVASFAHLCRDVNIRVLSIDLPSGLGADSQELPGDYFTASCTVTFGAYKTCHVAYPARSACGEVFVVDIGFDVDQTSRAGDEEGISDAISVNQVTKSDLARWWPTPDHLSDKYSRGVVGVYAGSPRYPGAGLLASLGAVYSGAGMVRFLGAAEAVGLVRTALPSVVTEPGRCQALVVGCGWTQDWGRPDVIDQALQDRLPLVVDAGAIDHLPNRADYSQAQADRLLLTPHAGELARALGQSRCWVEANPVLAAQHLARCTCATVLIKGASQYCVTGMGEVVIAIPGVAWTAQAGSGDVLAGICGTLLAAGLPAWKAGVMAASIQAVAATELDGPYPPNEVAESVPASISRLLTATASR